MGQTDTAEIGVSTTNAETDGAGTVAASTLSRETIFEMLSNTRRRYVLHCLFQEERQHSVRELSTQLAAWENEIPVSEVSYEQRRRVHTTLHQLHLPKLADSGIIEYDPRAGTVTLTPAAAELECYLDAVPHTEMPWSSWYLGLAVVAACGMTSSYLGLIPVSGIAWATLVVSLLAGTAAVHYRRDQRLRLGTDGRPPSYQ